MIRKLLGSLPTVKTSADTTPNDASNLTKDATQPDEFAGQNCVGQEAQRTGDEPFMIVEPNIEEKTEEQASAWSLIASSSWLSGQDFNLPVKPDFAPVKVGRGKDCDIIFPGTHLSREHVEIYIQETGLLVKDLNSANGTYINDQRVKQGFLRPGDTLRLDVYSFSVKGPELSTQQKARADEQIKLELLKDVANSEVRSQKDEDIAPTETSNLTDNKRWKTKPTSPGNRIEPEEIHGNLGLKISASVLLVVVIGLCGYLAFA